MISSSGIRPIWRMLVARIAHGYDSVANLGTKDRSQRRRTLHNGNAMVNGQYHKMN
jgi:hypothetical protein